jgi:5,10-methenyltetrahydrofolate synthetase
MTAQAGSASFPSSERDRLRRELRARRRNLSHSFRSQAARRFAMIATRTHLLRPHLRVAFYIPFGGEADPGELMKLARRLHCSQFLPVVSDFRRNRMRFVPFRTRDRLVANRYGIGEPRGALKRAVPVRTLDVIFVPLVAFDTSGARLGSGAGYYDRCLAHLNRERRWRKPKLIGLAYELQRVDRIASQPWDVPLDAVLTERTLYRCRVTK